MKSALSLWNFLDLTQKWLEQTGSVKTFEDEQMNNYSFDFEKMGTKIK